MRSALAILILLAAASTTNAQIISYQQEGPAARPLPQAVQKMDADQYAAWAEWHNQLAKRYADDFNSSKSRYRTGWRTVTSNSARSLSAYGGYRDRKSGEFGGRGVGGFNSTGESLTMKVRVKVPGQVKPVIYYNPYCKPVVPPKHDYDGAEIIQPYPNDKPDWDNIFGIVNGRIVSVNEVAETLMVPIPKERLYAQMLQPFRYTEAEKVPYGN